MRATGFSVYCFALASLNKSDTYVHQAKTMWKINASRLPWETRWQLMLTINFWQSITKLIWIQDNLVYENQITDYSNRTEGAIGIHLFQLRLLQRRMMHDAWSMFHSSRCIIVASLVNYVPATSLETSKANAADASMLCEQNIKTMYFKTLNPRLFDLGQWLRLGFFLW